ncbi:hypothetical protein AAFC00_006475 [Neodothiora populina]|uniref:FAD-binding FR-type domain-containing protein n=1 Tax=Neodothiora populina TaxID=2781224 RepID=A0ABR3P627_9PEZI
MLARLFVLSAAFFRHTLGSTLVSYPVAQEENSHNNHAHGYALYGFWGGIVLLGALHQLWQLWHLRTCTPETSNTNERGTIALRRYPAFIETLRHWSRTHLQTPPAFGKHHARLLYWCTIPTRLESVVILAYWIITIILVGTDYVFYSNDIQPTGGDYATTLGRQRWGTFANRCAVLALSNLPILWLFAGRNNILLWVTGWEFQTFNIFHRHVARVTILLIIGHAASYTHLDTTMTMPTGKTLYQEALHEEWYVWGIVAATTLGTFWLASVSWMRMKFYELFLAIHISLGILLIYAVFGHTRQEEGAFNGYLWAVVAIWSFDRLLRLIRLVVCNLHVTTGKNFVHVASTKATYDKVSDVIHVDIQTSGLALFRPGPGQHCFLYQPFSFKFWENHPFTIGSWSASASSSETDLESGTSSSDASSPIEKDDNWDSIVPATSRNLSTQLSRVDKVTLLPYSNKTLTFWIRPYDGWTRRLRDQCLKEPSGVCHPHLLMEGPYGHSKNLYMFDTVILVAGGTGISAVTPYITEQIARSYKGKTRTTDMRLMWSTRKARIVTSICTQELAAALPRSDLKLDVYLTGRVMHHDKVAMNNAGITYHHGRPDLEATVAEVTRELGPTRRAAVFVCGPSAMADNAREVVHAAMKRGCRNLEYFEDSFGW